MLMNFFCTPLELYNAKQFWIDTFKYHHVSAYIHLTYICFASSNRYAAFCEVEEEGRLYWYCSKGASLSCGKDIPFLLCLAHLIMQASFIWRKILNKSQKIQTCVKMASSRIFRGKVRIGGEEGGTSQICNSVSTKMLSPYGQNPPSSIWGFP